MFKNILRIVIGFIIGILLAFICIIAYFMYQDYKVEKEANELYSQDECYQYYYSKLDDKQKEDYTKIYYCLKKREDNIHVSNENLEEVEKIYYSVIDDHPEFFYVESNFQYIEMSGFVIFPKYSHSLDEIDQYVNDITKSTENIITQINRQTDKIQKIRMIYDYIIDKTEYKNHKDDQNMKSVFLSNESVCAGYARAYQYLLNKAGVDASYIGGKAIETSEGHAWVMISLDNNYYYSDPTWGDVVEEGMEHSCSQFFMMTSDEMEKLYVPDGGYEKTSDNHFNYFKSIDCYMEKYDRDIVDEAVKQGLSNKTRIAEIKCSNKTVFNQLKKEIEINYLGYHILKENNCYSSKAKYLCDENTLMVEIYY